jgi:predicted NUDIX family NTP pyrophosphohydrolase
MKYSAGILPYRFKDGKLQLFLAHFGGPFWRNKKRSWGIVKGEMEEGEDPLDAAKREFFEETGKRIDGEFLDLGEVKASGKINRVFAVEADLDTDVRSNTFTIEWPPKSGNFQEFPEIDRAAWFDFEEAKEVIVKSQLPFLERLKALLEGRSSSLGRN